MLWHVQQITSTRSSVARPTAFFSSYFHTSCPILLIYGDEADDNSNSIARIAATVKDLGKIELWLHQAVGQAAQHVTTLGPRA
jgi:hypothetical protein